MVSPSTPAVVIAAPASGSGKTTVATGLIGALRRSGSSVAPFKVGPDYIDPGYHGLAAGRPGRNLDTVLVGPDRIGPLYRHGTAGCDIAVVEGVMGLFDGKIDEANSQPSAEGSTAQVASILGSPVVLVIDARGHSQSRTAVLPGFATYDAGVRLGEQVAKDMIAKIYFSGVLGYNAQVFPTGKHPRTWADFWDAQKFPGPRMLADLASGAIDREFALVADGDRIRIDTDGRDLSRVITPIMLIANKKQNPSGRLTLFLDDIRYEMAP